MDDRLSPEQTFNLAKKIILEIFDTFPYPDYNNASHIFTTKNDLVIFSEWGHPNHEWFKKLWSPLLFDKDTVMEVGNKVVARGDFYTLQQNFYGFIEIFKQYINKPPYNDKMKNEVWYVLRHTLEKNLEGVTDREGKIWYS